LQNLHTDPSSISLAAEASKLEATASAFQPKQSSNISVQGSKQRHQAILSPTDILIGQVRAVLPHLGEGYIEAALACYDSDASQTISALNVPKKIRLEYLLSENL